MALYTLFEVPMTAGRFYVPCRVNVETRYHVLCDTCLKRSPSSVFLARTCQPANEMWSVVFFSDTYQSGIRTYRHCSILSVSKFVPTPTHVYIGSAWLTGNAVSYFKIRHGKSSSSDNQRNAFQRSTGLSLTNLAEGRCERIIQGCYTAAHGVDGDGFCVRTIALVYMSCV